MFLYCVLAAVWRSVAAGVSCFKEGSIVEAMQHLNKALKLDPENVEALVARGALYVHCASRSLVCQLFSTLAQRIGCIS